VAKRKAKAALPAVGTETKRPNKAMIASVLVVLGGLLLFWRTRADPDEYDPEG
jgi:hypothetical protein